MKDTLSKMLDEILKLTGLNRHNDGSHEVKSLELEGVTNTIHNLWVDAHNELTTARETNKSLHRRCQLAESAVQENIAACKKQGQSLGRRLSASGYLMVEAELAKLKEYHKGGCIDCDHYAKVMSLKAQLATEQDKNRWIPVAERLPENPDPESEWSEKVQVLNIRTCFLGHDWYLTIQKQWKGGHEDRYTHWRPIILPEAKENT